MGCAVKRRSDDPTRAILEGLIGLFGLNRRWLLFFGTGTSRAMDERLGMPSLTDHLRTQLGGAPGWPQINTRLEAGESRNMSMKMRHFHKTFSVSLHRSSTMVC